MTAPAPDNLRRFPSLAFGYRADSLLPGEVLVRYDGRNETFDTRADLLDALLLDEAARQPGLLLIQGGRLIHFRDQSELFTALARRFATTAAPPSSSPSGEVPRGGGGGPLRPLRPFLRQLREIAAWGVCLGLLAGLLAFAVIPWATR